MELQLLIKWVLILCKIIAGGFILAVLFGVGSILWAFGVGIIKSLFIGRTLKKQGSHLRQYFESFNLEHPLTIIDETPRLLKIGSGKGARTYTLKPLKYRQVSRLCILLAKIIEKLRKSGVDVDNVDDAIGVIIEKSEHDFFRALALILYFSQWPNEDNEEVIADGVVETFNFLRNNITLAQITTAIEIIVIQNDIQRALKSFGALNAKKKMLQAT